jgi:Putative adhesin
MRTLLVTATLLLATAAGAADLTETIDRTFDVRPGANVAISNVNGRITIKSWDQPRVRVIAKKEVDGDRDELQQALKELRVEMQPRDGGLVVTTHYPKNSEGVGGILSWLSGDHIDAEVQYDVTVPRNMNVDVSNTNGGIHLSDISGNLELDTTNGRIEVKRCAGSLDASTTNGSIDAELLRVAKDQPLRFETTNGRIEVAVPANVTADVDASTTNGSINSDLPVATTRTSSNSLRGTINGGGTSLRMRTTNGGITIRRAG